MQPSWRPSSPGEPGGGADRQGDGRSGCALLAKIEAALPAKDVQAPRVPVVRVPDMSRRILHTLAGTGCTTPSRPALAAHWLPGCQRQQDGTPALIPWGSSTGADAGRSAPGVRCVEPTGISGWIASTPWRRAAGEGAHGATLADYPPAPVGCVSPGAVAPKKSFRTDKAVSSPVHAGFSRPSTTEKNDDHRGDMQQAGGVEFAKPSGSQEGVTEADCSPVTAGRVQGSCPAIRAHRALPAARRRRPYADVVMAPASRWWEAYCQQWLHNDVAGGVSDPAFDHHSVNMSFWTRIG